MTMVSGTFPIQYQWNKSNKSTDTILAPFPAVQMGSWLRPYSHQPVEKSRISPIMGRISILVLSAHTTMGLNIENILDRSFWSHCCCYVMFADSTFAPEKTLYIFMPKTYI